MDEIIPIPSSISPPLLDGRTDMPDLCGIWMLGSDLIGADLWGSCDCFSIGYGGRVSTSVVAVEEVVEV